ncbi:NAD(P)-dependent oxidoreductase [Actinoallomurus sp. NPDC052274]|uniref:NAD(P)-dependent oxidoreductase n=1 Tax=Actinoallomurus sp. NPDC052274 TaxID=3155420 RepID=UPI00344A81A4
MGSDHVLGEILDCAAEELRGQGIDVVRGPAQPPPARTLYAPHEWDHYFGRAGAILVSSRTLLPRPVLAAAPRLRGVVFGSIGCDSCDLDAATELGIIVANGATPQNADSMAEAVVMLAVALLLELPDKQRRFARMAARRPPRSITSRMLAGRTLGLVGFGRTAQAVVRRLAGWDLAEIRVHTRRPDPVRWPQVRFVGLGELLAESDVVSVHVPATDQTRGMIGAPELAAMKPGSVLINTARGGIVDEEALARVLGEGHLAGAAIDTYLQEPPPPDHPLRGVNTVIGTDHVIGHTREMFDSLAPAAVDNVTAILAGRLPRYVCNPDVIARWQARHGRSDPASS